MKLSLKYTCTSCYYWYILRTEGVRGWFSLPLRAFFSLLTLSECPIYNVCPYNMHDSRYNWNIVYQIRLSVWFRSAT